MIQNRMLDKELNKRCVQAIKKGTSKHAFFIQLKLEGRGVSQERVDRVWREHGGPVQPRRK